MFENFYRFVGIENPEDVDSPEAFLKCFSGATFKNGLYRIHNYGDIAKWTKIVEDAFPNYKGNMAKMFYVGKIYE